MVGLMAEPSPAAAQQATPTLARCQQLIDQYDRYCPRGGEGSACTGSRLDRGVAEVQCARGQYAEGIRTLEAALKRNLIAIPPPR